MLGNSYGQGTVSGVTAQNFSPSTHALKWRKVFISLTTRQPLTTRPNLHAELWGGM